MKNETMHDGGTRTIHVTERRAVCVQTYMGTAQHNVRQCLGGTASNNNSTHKLQCVGARRAKRAGRHDMQGARYALGLQRRSSRLCAQACSARCMHSQSMREGAA